MTPLQVAYGVAACVALAWTLVRLTRRLRHIPLWAITGLIACWAAAYPFGLVANAESSLLGMSPMTSRLIQHVLLLIGVNSLAYFFLFSALERRCARTRALWYAVPLVIAVAVLIIAAATTPPGTLSKDRSVTSVALFFLTADLYMAFGFAMAWWWARRYARIAEPRLARGLRLSSVGLAALVLANCVFIPAIILRWANAGSPHGLLARHGSAETLLGWIGSVFLLLPGIVLFLVGVTYPAFAQRLAALRVWWQHRRVYRELFPLWTELNKAFPQDRLPRLPSHPWRDALSPLGVHRRYYRRIVECRDGLVRLSPYLAALDTNGGGSTADLAECIQTALRSHATNEAVEPNAVPIALPANDTLDADADTLVALSRALRTTQNSKP